MAPRFDCFACGPTLATAWTRPFAHRRNAHRLLLLSATVLAVLLALAACACPRNSKSLPRARSADRPRSCSRPRGGPLFPCRRRRRRRRWHLQWLHRQTSACKTRSSSTNAHIKKHRHHHLRRRHHSSRSKTHCSGAICSYRFTTHRRRDPAILQAPRTTRLISWAMADAL